MRTPGSSNSGRRRERERGIALVVVMMVTVAVTTLGVTASWMASTHVRVSQNVTDRQNALYAAEAGLERAREILASSTNWGSDFLAPTLIPPGAAGANGANMTAPPLDPPSASAGNLKKKGRPMIKTAGGTISTPSNWLYNVCYPCGTRCNTQGTSCCDNVCPGSSGRYSVWIRNNTAEIAQGVIDGDNDGLVIVHVEGYSADGVAKVTLEVGVAKGGATTASPSYGGINENNENSNTLTTTIDYSASPNVTTATGP